MTATVLLTDFAWPDDSIEREVIERAGLRLVSGPAKPTHGSEIEELVKCRTTRSDSPLPGRAD